VELSDGGTESLDTKNIVLATGSEVTPLPPVPVDNAAGKIVDSTGALEIASIPQTMAVVGGGVIGLEMGSVWSRLGTDVTVIEFMDRLCPSMDAEVTKKFQTILKKQGFKFQLKTKVMESRLEDDGVVLKTEASKGGKEKEAKYDVVLVATGRRPYTDGLGLEALGIQTDRLGRIEVDEHFRTAVPSIYAIGDCIDGPMLAHKAEEEGIAAVETIAGYAGHVNYDAIPGVIYTYPEVASVGKTEEELKEAGVAYNVGTFPFQANSRARANGSSEGFVKILSEKETDRMLGSHIIGPNAGEMIAEAVLAIGEFGLLEFGIFFSVFGRRQVLLYSVPLPAVPSAAATIPSSLLYPSPLYHQPLFFPQYLLLTSLRIRCQLGGHCTDLSRPSHAVRGVQGGGDGCV